MGPHLTQNLTLIIGFAGVILAFGAFALRQLGVLKGGAVLDPLLMVVIAGCTLYCQLCDERLPSIVTQSGWVLVGGASLLRVAAERVAALRANAESADAGSANAADMPAPASA